MSNLRKKTLSGVLWSFSRLFSVQLTTFFVQLVLARILMPEAFGLIAMLQIFISIGQSLMDSGMSTSLIRTADADQRDYSTVFFINLIVSIVVYIIIYANAGYISAFYNQPLLSSIIRVYAISIILQSFVSVQLAKLTKEMNFKLQLILEIPAVIVSCALGIWMAYNNYGVWSLVWMALSKTTIFTIQVWIFSKWSPSLIFDWVRLKKHFNFGYKLTLSGLLNTIYDNIYNIIIGKFFSITQLGFYDRANSLRLLPVQTLSSALNKVTFPMFASIQDDNARLKATYKKLMQQIVFWIAPMMILAVIIAEPLFRMVLTEKWLPAVPYFQILCIASILYPLHVYNLNIVNVKGRSDLFLKLEIVKKIVVTVIILCALPFGIYGLLVGQLVTTVLNFLINTFYSGSLINYSTSEQLVDIAPILTLAVGCGVLTWLFNNYLLIELQFDFVEILLSFLVFGILYLGLSYFLKFTVLFELKNILFKR